MEVNVQYISPHWLQIHTCHTLTSCCFPYCTVFWLLQNYWGCFNLCTGVLHRTCVPCVLLVMSVCLWICVSVQVFMWEREKERVRERCTTAKARSPDIIEDDISDYPKDRNLSLSAIYFQLFYCSAFSRYAALNFVWKLNKLCFYRIEMRMRALLKMEMQIRLSFMSLIPVFIHTKHNKKNVFALVYLSQTLQSYYYLSI